MIGDENAIGTMQRGSMAMAYGAPPRHVSKVRAGKHASWVLSRSTARLGQPD